MLAHAHAPRDCLAELTRPDADNDSFTFFTRVNPLEEIKEAVDVHGAEGSVSRLVRRV